MRAVAPASLAPEHGKLGQAAVSSWLLVLGIGVAVGLLAAAALILLDARQELWWEAERSSDNLVQALERDIARNIQIYDQSLMGAINALAQPGLAEAPPGLRHAALFDGALSAEYMGAVFVSDANGNVVFDSTSLTPHRLNLADRDYFQAQRNADQGLFLSRPFSNRLRNGELSIAISRRVSGPSGEFAGVVSGGLRLAYFDQVFRGLDLGNDGVVLLLQDGGHLLARRPSVDTDDSASAFNGPVPRAILASNSGFVHGVSPIDGVERVIAFRRVGNLPLHVAVGLSVPEIMAPWWRKAAVIGAILLGLASAELAMCLLFRREMARRLQAEASLKEAARRLQQAANTDALTGLANRRAFQAGLDRSWRTAARNKTGIALLMIDADAFKKFNDRYGHQAGDRVLHLLGDAILGNLRRPGDLGARYGGEEFSVLLPDTDLAGACLVAERILADVQSAAIPHADAPAGFVTVSIGVSVCHPAEGEISGVLVRSADAALYNAKRSGRNRICIAEDVSHAPAPRQLAG